jgi:hypothetical protein
MARLVVSLFDYTGIMVQPWAEAGFDCICVDILHPEAGRYTDFGLGTISYIKLDLYAEASFEILKETLKGNSCFIIGFPVCTDLSISGAKHWETKRTINPNFQLDAIRPALRIDELSKYLDCEYMIENPQSRLSKLWRKEDHTFDPCDYGGYLPASSPHPLYPNVIPAQDAYEKHTCIWSSKGFVMPPKARIHPQFALYKRWNGERLKVSPIVAKTGGDTPKTKNIRSATPRGFAKAVFLHNRGIL